MGENWSLFLQILQLVAPNLRILILISLRFTEMGLTSNFPGLPGDRGSANNGFGPIPWKNEYQY